MTKLIVFITGLVWASLLLISWGGTVDSREMALPSDQSQTGKS